MAISARNVFKGTITRLKQGPISAEVDITTGGGDTIVAVVTQASLLALALAEGMAAVAVIKAPWVTLLSGTPEYRFSARNQLQGTVKEVVSGAVNSQIAVALPGGATVYAVITNDTVADLQLVVGAPVVALFKASHVIVGVPA